MSEQISAIPESVEAIRERFRLQLGFEHEYAPMQDPILAAFAAATLRVLEDPTIAKHYDYVFSARAKRLQPLSSSELVTQNHRSFQHQLWVPGNDYPRDRESIDVCEADIRSIFSDEMGHSTWGYDMVARTVQSNIVDRYKAIKLFAAMQHDRLGNEVAILDVGCSRNHGMKALVQKLPFKAVGFDSVVNAENILDDERYRKAIRTLMSESIDFSGRGVDFMTESRIDPFIANWCAACSVYPSKILNAEQTDVSDEVKYYRYLDNLDIAGLKPVYGDFTDPELDILLKGGSPQKFDIVSFLTMMYQVPAHERPLMFENAKRYAKPDGFIVIQDFAKLDESQPIGLGFADGWTRQPFPYRMHVYDMSAPEQGLQEVMQWSSGRCQQVRITAGNLLTARFFELAEL